MLPNIKLVPQKPPVFLFLVDQSLSMGEKLADGQVKAAAISDLINRTINSLIKKCYENFNIILPCKIGIVGYGGRGIQILTPGEGGILQTLPILAQHPARIEKRKKKETNAAGEIYETEINFPIWVEAASFGGTPLCAALFECIKRLKEIYKTSSSFMPPVILNICDGKATDGEPEDLIKILLKLSGTGNNPLLYNLNLASSGYLLKERIFPANEYDLEDEFSKRLFYLSSALPLHMLPKSVLSYSINQEPRGLMVHVQEFVRIVEFFDIINKCPVQ